MTEELKAKLREIFAQTIQVTRIGEATDPKPEDKVWFTTQMQDLFVLDFEHALAQIKQVFIDAGALLPDKNGNYHISNATFVGENNRIPGHMTGQEWYDRFEKIVNEDTEHFRADPNLSAEDLPRHITGKVLEAAKKASGLS